MKNEITYILGAGASYYSMPLVENFPDRFQIFKSFLNSIRGNSFLEYSLFDEKVGIIVRDCEEFQREVQHHISFDTFFKKLFHLPGDSSKRRDKEILLLFFLFEHLLDVKNFTQFQSSGIRKEIGLKKGTQDPRYDALIAGLLEPIAKKFSLTAKANFITWNYDLNLFSALKGFIDSEQPLNKFVEKSKIDNNYFELNQDVSIVHLNGYIAYDLKNINSLPIETLKVIFANLINRYANEDSLIRKFSSFLNFSWETLASREAPNDLPTYIKKAVDSIRRSSVIVIIGYSFPLYNRLIDTLLINKENLKGKSVYIQNPNANEVIQLLQSDFGLRYRMINKVPQSSDDVSELVQEYPLYPIENCNSFFVPSQIFPTISNS
jgi:hypothetical protein